MHGKEDELQKKKLEFYLQLHFTIYPICNFRTNDNHIYPDELAVFKTYLEEKGSELSQTSEFVTYYALPYVPNPIDHKSFKHLFTKEFN